MGGYPFSGLAINSCMNSCSILLAIAELTVMDSRCPSVNTRANNVSFISAIPACDRLKFGFCANHVAAHTK